MNAFAWTTFGWATLAAFGGVVLVVGATFAIAQRVGRHNVIDTAWGLGFLVALLVADAVAVSSEHHDGTARRVLITGLTAAWSLRLAAHMAIRSRGEGEDPRYADMLAKGSGNRTASAVRIIYVPQAARDVVRFAPPAGDRRPRRQHRRRSGGSAPPCGSWASSSSQLGISSSPVSRRTPRTAARSWIRACGATPGIPITLATPAQWWGFALIAFAHWPGILTIASPALMTWFLARKTGKPLLESRMAKTRPGYAEYIERTSGFFPLPPKRAAGARS